MNPRELAPSRVLVPASAETGARIAPLLRSAGFEPVLAPLIASEPVELDDESAKALAEAGSADWVVLTSKATVAALGDRLPSGRCRMAVVGQPTAQALVAAGGQADLVGRGGGGTLAESIVAAGSRSASDTGLGSHSSLGSGAHGVRVVVIGSAQSHHDLDERLRAGGASVERIDLYRTVAVAAPEPIIADVNAGEIAIVLVTSGTVAEQLKQQFGSALDRMQLVSLGAQTTADARRIGLRVDRQPSRPTLPDLVAAVRELLAEPDGSRPSERSERE